MMNKMGKIGLGIMAFLSLLGTTYNGLTVLEGALNNVVEGIRLVKKEGSNHG